MILSLFILKVHKQARKRFQIKSNGRRDVQYTGLQSTQTRRNTGKQGAQTRSLGTSSQASLRQWLLKKLLGC